MTLDTDLATLREELIEDGWLEHPDSMLAVLDRLEAALRDKDQEIKRLERERDYLRERGDKNARRAQAAEREVERLQQALGAYRSALRSGEHESEQLRQMGDKALAGPDTPADSLVSKTWPETARQILADSQEDKT